MGLGAFDLALPPPHPPGMRLRVGPPQAGCWGWRGSGGATKRGWQRPQPVCVVYYDLVLRADIGGPVFLQPGETADMSVED